MFLNLGTQQKKQMNPIHSKIFENHSIRSTYEKERKKKTLRFQNLMRQVFREKLKDYENIDSLSEAKSMIRKMMINKDLVHLAYSIIDVQNNVDLKEIFDVQFLNEIVSFSQNSLYRPQIVMIYKYLSEYNLVFPEVVFQKKWLVIGKIVRQVKNMKQSQYQTFYLQILQNLFQKCSKRWEQQIQQNFDDFLDMVQNFITPFQNGLQILVAVCPFVTKKRHFQLSTVQALIECYEKQMKCNQNMTVRMTDCFLIITKIILYQKNFQILTNFRMMKILKHALSTFPGKIIEQYYNIFNLLSILIQKTKQSEQQRITHAEFYQIKKKLTDQYQNYQNTQNMSLTDIILKQIFSSRQFLNIKIYDLDYLNLIRNLVKCCSLEIYINLFIQTGFIDFLYDCVDHLLVEIKILALEIIAQIAKDQNSFSFFEIMDAKLNIIRLMQQKISYHPNPKLCKLAEFIIERLYSFNKLSLFIH